MPQGKPVPELRDTNFIVKPLKQCIMNQLWLWIVISLVIGIISAFVFTSAVNRMAEVPEDTTDNAAGMKFCPECGSKIASENVCPECGNKVKPTAKFCPECGHKLK